MRRDLDFIGWHQHARRVLRASTQNDGTPKLAPDFIIFDPLWQDRLAYNFAGTVFRYDYPYETSFYLFIKETLVYTALYRAAFWSSLANPFRMFDRECRPDADTLLIDQRFWDRAGLIFVRGFKVRFRFIHELETHFDFILHRRRSLWATSNSRDIADFSSPTPSAVVDAHSVFRRACFLNNIKVDYSEWCPKTALLKSMLDPYSWFGFWPRWRDNIGTYRNYDLISDPFMIAWLVAPSSRRNVSYGSMKFYVTKYIGAFPDIPYVFSPALTYIDVMADACAVSGYSWF